MARGPEALTDAELLEILLRTGVEGMNAVELAREILLTFGSVPAMITAPLTAWRDIKGVGSAKLAQVLAVLELGRRAVLPDRREETFVKRTAQAAAYFNERVRIVGNQLDTDGALLGCAWLARQALAG